jgi:arabinose-5-phosphate isomerase
MIDGDGMPLTIGRRVLRQEGEAVLRCAAHLDGRFGQAVSAIFQCAGRVITCGVGKSGHIARKAAGTLSSTGTPSGFLHASEAVHGDLGMVTAADVLMMYSHSGETDELVRLFPAIRSIGARVVLVTGRPESSAGRAADIVLDTGVIDEACPNNLAPTTSTTVMLALSDALALAVMEQRGFSREDFARFLPSGALGKRLLLTVADVMRPTAEIAAVSPRQSVLEVLRAMTDAHVGAACVVEHGALVGIVSESDWRRHLLNSPARLDAPAAEIMNRDPVSIDPSLLAVEALEAFQNYPIKIGEMPVLADGRLVGLLVLKDLLRSGIV